MVLRLVPTGNKFDIVLVRTLPSRNVLKMKDWEKRKGRKGETLSPSLILGGGPGKREKMKGEIGRGRGEREAYWGRGVSLASPSLEGDSVD